MSTRKEWHAVRVVCKLVVVVAVAAVVVLCRSIMCCAATSNTRSRTSRNSSTQGSTRSSSSARSANELHTTSAAGRYSRTPSRSLKAYLFYKHQLTYLKKHYKLQ